jgi:hypothetical protein
VPTLNVFNDFHVFLPWFRAFALHGGQRLYDQVTSGGCGLFPRDKITFDKVWGRPLDRCPFAQARCIQRFG